MKWLGILRKPDKWDLEIQWAQQMIKGRKVRSETLSSLLAATVYSLWIERNDRRFNGVDKPAEILVRRLILDCHVKESMYPKWGRIVKELTW